MLPMKRKAMLQLMDAVKKISPDTDEYDTQLGELEDLIEDYCKTAETVNAKGYVPLPIIAMFGTPHMECLWLIGAPLPMVTVKNKDGTTEEVRRTVDLGNFGVSPMAPYFVTSSVMFSTYPEAAAFAHSMTIGLMAIKNEDVQELLAETSAKVTQEESESIAAEEEMN